MVAVLSHVDARHNSFLAPMFFAVCVQRNDCFSFSDSSVRKCSFERFGVNLGFGRLVEIGLRFVIAFHRLDEFPSEKFSL
jgi:hypothetical protein